jgi:ssDNA-binding Zn-finger/Zn-ribbon topoisomerase 1
VKCPACGGAYVLRIQDNTRTLTCPHCFPEKVHPTLLHVMGLPTRDSLDVERLIAETAKKGAA